MTLSCKTIPLSVPVVSGNEWKYIKECLDTGWVSSAGKFIDQFEQKIAEYTGAKYSIACINGTSALQVSLRLAGVLPGDEVIVPTITFIAPVNAIQYNGATPIFMDADKYYNLDVEKTVQYIHEETVYKKGFTYNKKTDKRIPAIVPVHIWGNAVWLDELAPLCRERNITIVEDASESLGTRYIQGSLRTKHTGTIGELGCLSFNGNKIITTGGGGMILTDDAELAEKAKYLTTQAKDDDVHYVHNEIGYNFRLTNVQGAMGLAQLEKLPDFLERKMNIYRQYTEAVKHIEGLGIAPLPDYARNNHWLNLLQIDSAVYGRDRESLMEYLWGKNIQTRPIWQLNHVQKSYEDCQTYQIENAPSLLRESLCLPSSSNLSDEDIKRVINYFHIS
jgi:aminotransferase in exopolysaccharide biosynthesis|tara:strand:+ start:28 stop:1200 length:1173 start_codon:yes stop_codon:yes gene_type:complete